MFNNRHKLRKVIYPPLTKSFFFHEYIKKFFFILFFFSEKSETFYTFTLKKILFKAFLIKNSFRRQTKGVSDQRQQRRLDEKLQKSI